MIERYGDDCIHVKSDAFDKNVDLVVLICGINGMSVYEFKKMYGDDRFNRKMEYIGHDIEWTIYEWAEGHLRYKDMDVVTAVEYDLEDEHGITADIYQKV